MKTITFNSNFGHFATKLAAQFSDETADVVAEGFLADMLYRICGSAVDKALGVGKKEGSKFAKRNELPYSVESKAVIEKSVGAKIEELLKDEDHGDAYLELELTFAVTGEHEFGESQSAMVRATNLVDTFLADEDMEKAYRTVFGLQGCKDAATAGRDALIEFAHSKGLGVSTKKQPREAWREMNTSWLCINQHIFNEDKSMKFKVQIRNKETRKITTMVVEATHYTWAVDYAQRNTAQGFEVVGVVWLCD